MRAFVLLLACCLVFVRSAAADNRSHRKLVELTAEKIDCNVTGPCMPCAEDEHDSHCFRTGYKEALRCVVVDVGGAVKPPKDDAKAEKENDSDAGEGDRRLIQDDNDVRLSYCWQLRMPSRLTRFKAVGHPNENASPFGNLRVLCWVWQQLRGLWCGAGAGCRWCLARNPHPASFNCNDAQLLLT
eukprot:jgi/Chlat1/6656/Chrsp49S06127